MLVISMDFNGFHHSVLTLICSSGARLARYRALPAALPDAHEQQQLLRRLLPLVLVFAMPSHQRVPADQRRAAAMASSSAPDPLHGGGATRGGPGAGGEDLGASEAWGSQQGLQNELENE